MATHSQSPANERKHQSPPSSARQNGDDDGDVDNKSKRKSSASAHDEENGKKKRRKVNHACVYCRRSHMTCDLERPCARCIKRDIGHLCHDEPRDPPRGSKSDLGVADIAPAPDGGMNDDMGSVNGSFAQGAGDIPTSLGMAGAGEQSAGALQLVQPTPISPMQLQRPVSNAATNNVAGPFMPNTFDWNNSTISNQFQDMHHLHPNYMFSTPEVTNEYNMLNEFLSNSLVDDGALYNYDSDAHQMFVNDPLLATSSVNAMNSFQGLQPQQQNIVQPGQSMAAPPQPQAELAQNTAQSQSRAGEEISRPSSAFPSSEQSRNKFYMTAADPAGLSSAEDRLHKLLKAKYDAGMLKPFNYVKGYARLSAYMSQHLSRESMLRILKQLDRFRPKFREATQKLTDMQLVLVEMWFERSLMEYDRVLASMAIPACCWRRTGEIFRGNREMAELIGVPWEKLRDGKLAIHEIIAEDSLVSYWEKFGAIAFDQSQKAILTSCSLKTPRSEDDPGGGNSKVDGNEDDSKRSSRKSISGQGPGGGKERKKEGELVKCCFSFTIRRDTHNIPSLIVGNFLPIRQRPGFTSQASRAV